MTPDLCRLVSDLASCRALHVLSQGEPLLSRARSVLKQRRTFYVIGPLTWNGLRLTLRLTCPLSTNFGHS